jgi:hypothetical protein
MANASRTWQENLKQWQNSDLPGLSNSLNEIDMLVLVHGKMQELYPGNYSLDWKFDSVTGAFKLYPKFNTPEDETWFILKYS